MSFKKVAIFVLLLLSGSADYLFAQKPSSTSFFDKTGKLSSVEDAFYFRETTDTASFYRSFYASDSTLFFQGKIVNARDSSDQKNIYSGLCIWYYSNANKKAEYNYNTSGVLNGVCTDYFENGMQKKIVEYENGKPKTNGYSEFGANGAQAYVFEENFLDNRNAWLLNTNDTGSVKLKIGGLEFNSSKSCGFIRSFSRKLNSANYSVESIINSNYLLDSTKAGLLFNYKDALNYNYFVVSRHRCYIGEVVLGKEIKKVNAFYLYTLKGNAWNRIKVIQSNNKVFYSVNDEILFSEEHNGDIYNGIGLGIKSSGIAHFDKITIKEYQNELTIEPTDARIKNDNNFIISNKDYGIQNASMGLILNKQGLIITSAAPFTSFNQIIIEAFVNDTIKQFGAELVIKNETNNLAVLKIKNLQGNEFHDIAYSFYEKANLELESTLHSIYFAKSDTNSNKPKIIQGNLKSKARFENLSNYFEASLRTENIAQGAPIFTGNGELLGVITTPSIRNNAVATKLSAVEQLLFFSNQNFKKSKKPTIPNSMELISKNVVLIKIK